MDAKQLDKCRQQLYDTTPLVGREHRRQATEMLAQDGSPEAVRALAEAVTRSDDEQVYAIAMNALRKQTDQRCIEAMCEVWVTMQGSILAFDRHVRLTQLLSELGCMSCGVPPEPLLHTLKAGRLEAVIEGGESVVAPLVRACGAMETEIADRSLKCLMQLRSPDAIDVICARWAEKREPLLAQVMIEAGYLARQPITVRILGALKLGRLDLITGLGAEIIEPLLKACQDVDADVAQRARACLTHLQNPRAIDALCELWATKRDSLLTEAVMQAGYVAQEPITVRVLSVLKAGKLDIITDGGAEVVEPLLHASSDIDPDIARQARQALGQLKTAESKEALCRLVLENDHPLARQVALDAQYTPRNETQRALFYFLTEQWEKYETLDFEHVQLETVYHLADEKLRKRIVEKAVQAGRTEWVDVAIGGRRRRRLGEMTDREWGATLTVLVAGRRWRDMWRLAQDIPPKWSAEILRRITATGWRPEREEELTAYVELIQSAERLDKVEPVIGRLVCCQVVLKGHSGAIECLAISPDGRMLASGSQDGTVRVWSLPNGQELKTLERQRFGNRRQMTSLAISPNGDMLASRSGDEVHLWSLRDGRLLETISSRISGDSCLAISPEGQVLEAWNDYGSVGIHRLTGERVSRYIEKVSLRRFEQADCLAISPDGRLLATGEGGYYSGRHYSSVHLWSLPDGCELTTLEGYEDTTISCLAFSPDGHILASGTRDGWVQLRRLPDGAALRSLRVQAGINCLAVGSAGRVLVGVCPDKSMLVWNPTNEQAVTLQDQATEMTCLAISADGKMVVSGGRDHVVQLWASNLVRLTDLPVGQIARDDWAWAQEMLRDKWLFDAERKWLEFIVALIRLRRQFDIELEERPRQVSVGEFDIELEDGPHRI